MGTRTWMRAVAAGAALAAAASGVGAPAAAGGREDEGPDRDGLDRYYAQRLDWQDCALGPGDAAGQDLDAAGARCAGGTVLDNDVPALLVSATGDPRSVHAGAEELRARWPSARLLTLEGAAQHGVYGEYGNACADGRVNAYLATGRLPHGDPVCAA